jgi:hypothetical protein
VQEELGVNADALSHKSRRHPARKVFAKLCHQLPPATLEKIARVLGLAGPDAVHKTILIAAARLTLINVMPLQ